MSPNCRLNIYLHPMDGSGHVAACTGLAQELASRGHSISFLVNHAYAGQFAKHSFTEILLHETDNSQEEEDMATKENPVKVIAEIILKKLNLLNGKSPLEKIKDHQLPEEDSFMSGLLDKMVQFDGQIEHALQKGKPDVIILDHFLIPPAIARSGIPWVFLFSGNPLPMYGSTSLPPYGSGYPTNSDPSSWREFQSLVEKVYIARYSLYQLRLYETFNYCPSETELSAIQGDLFPKSPYLNMYGYPSELDYHDIVPRPEKFISVDGFYRESTEHFQLPEGFAKEDDTLLYFSLGSMGSVDVQLMKRITGILGRTPYRCIVSKGPLGDEYTLPANCWGAKFLPQAAILKQVHLVISHGGNNTITETLACGKPIIVLPLFADQYDNGRRMEEKGFGVQLDTYHFEEHQLRDAIERLLKDEGLKGKLQLLARRITEEKRIQMGCREIERLVE